MQSLIEVFRMTEVSAKVRCDILVKLGDSINMQYGSNLTEPLVLELVRQLGPTHEVCTNPHYLFSAKEISLDEWRQRTGMGL